VTAFAAAGNVGVGSWIERRARAAPDAVTPIAGNRSLTYANLAGRVRRLANGLQTLGVAAGDRVAWVGPNHPAFLESLFAAGLLGAALAPVNHRLDDAQIGWILEDTKPRVIISNDAAAVLHGGVPRVAVGGSQDGAADFEDLISKSPGHAVEETVGLDDLCMLPHTSGTTGRPKGVMLTHGNVTWNVINVLTYADFRSDDVTIAFVPFFRVGGSGVNVLPVVFMGGTVVVPDDVSPDNILMLTEQHHVTVGFGNPDLLAALVRTPLWPTADLSSVRFLITGGAPVHEPLIGAYLVRGLTLLQGYGLSEAAPVALLLQPDSALSKVGSAGTPPLFVDTKIVGSDDEAVRPSQTGELIVRGPNVMAGYWNRPEETAEVLSADGCSGPETRRALTRAGTSGSLAGSQTASFPAGRSSTRATWSGYFSPTRGSPRRPGRRHQDPVPNRSARPSSSWPREPSPQIRSSWPGQGSGFPPTSSRPT
jgi:acyl-CoA synthetase (AMP-forming)/AMP-acid ligase II